MISLTYRFNLLFSLLIALISVSYTTLASAKANPELVYKFAVYVTWPNDLETITFCVVGNNKFAEALEKVVENKKIGKRNLVVKNGGSGCNVVVGIGTSVSGGNGVLTVSDVEGFAKNGNGMIEFINERSHFVINNSVAKKKKVRISSQLLKLAKDVY